MAKTKAPAADATQAQADDVAPADLGDDDPQIAALKAQLAALTAERDAHKAENERLKSQPPPAEYHGKRYRVSVKDGPTAVVEPKPGQHPHDAYKELCGIQRSENPFSEPAETDEMVSLPDGTEAPTGIVRHKG